PYPAYFGWKVARGRIESICILGAREHMIRPKVLYIASRVPYPPDNGLAIRQFHLLRAYAEVADVTVAYLHETDENETIDFGPLNELCEQVHRISLDTTFRRSRFDRLSRWRRRLHQLTTRRPLRVTLGLSERLSHLVEDLAPKMSVIHVSRLVM